MEWQPIATAPLNEEPILVANDQYAGGNQTVVCWEPDDLHPTHPWNTEEDLRYHQDAFTHWQPLGPGPGDMEK